MQRENAFLNMYLNANSLYKNYRLLRKGDGINMQINTCKVIYTENRLICASPKKEKENTVALLYPSLPFTHTPMFIGMSYRLALSLDGGSLAFF